MERALEFFEREQTLQVFRLAIHPTPNQIVRIGIPFVKNLEIAFCNIPLFVRTKRHFPKHHAGPGLLTAGDLPNPRGVVHIENGGTAFKWHRLDGSSLVFSGVKRPGL
ncbi:MAG: hypothetical protein WAO02_08840 [Verrucomicrobiia bacterium]